MKQRWQVPRTMTNRHASVVCNSNKLRTECEWDRGTPLITFGSIDLQPNVSFRRSIPSVFWISHIVSIVQVQNTSFHKQPSLSHTRCESCVCIQTMIQTEMSKWGFFTLILWSGPTIRLGVEWERVIFRSLSFTETFNTRLVYPGTAAAQRWCQCSQCVH